MTRLGQILVRSDLVSENHLARALGVQHFAGGRIGTLLLERGALHEDDLGRALAEQHDCEYVPWPVLDNVSPAAIAALPAKFAIRHSAVPWDRGEGFLRIALRDPADLRILDELFFVTGRKVIPCVAPEVRIFQALEKYYAERRTPRYAILAEKLSRIPAREVAKVGPPPPPDFFPDSPARIDPASLAASEAPAPPRSETRMPDKPLTPQTMPWAPVGVPESGPPGAFSDDEIISWEELSPPPMWIPTAPGRRATPAPPPSAPAPPPAAPLAPLAAAAASSEPRESPRVEPPPPPPPAAVAPPAARVPAVDAPRPHWTEPAEEPTPAEPAPAAIPPAPPAATPPAPRRAPRPPRPAERPAAASARPPRPAPPQPGAGGMRLAPETFDFPEVLAARARGPIVEATLVALLERFARAAVFGCKPDRISGLAGGGDGIDPARVATIEIPWADPSVFLNVRLSRSFYLGALPPLPRHKGIADAMGKWAEECVVQPVWIKDKPVAFLYAEFDPERGATPMDLAYLRGLAGAAATSLAASIRSKRAG